MDTRTALPKLTDGWLAGAALSALMNTPMALPLVVGIAGFAFGSGDMGTNVLAALAHFVRALGRPGLAMLALATFVALTLLGLAFGHRPPYARKWLLGDALFDDTRTPGEKLRAVLASWPGRLLLAIDLLLVVVLIAL
jgi:hypothetical protein